MNKMEGKFTRTDPAPGKLPHRDTFQLLRDGTNEPVMGVHVVETYVLALEAAYRQQRAILKTISESVFHADVLRGDARVALAMTPELPT